MISSNCVLIAAAVPAELATIDQSLSGKKVLRRGPVELHTGSINGREVATLVSGAGPVNMAGALGAVFTLQPPKMVMVTGCGGAFGGSGLLQGDVALATEEIHGQLGVEDGHPPAPPNDLPFLRNRYPLDHALVERAFSAFANRTYAAKHKVLKGPFLTVATVTSRADTAAEYRRRYNVIMENMEGFAATALCKQYDIPMMELRAVSNMVGQTDRSTWKLDLAFERAQEAILSILEAM